MKYVAVAFTLALAVVATACSSRELDVTPAPSRVVRPPKTEPVVPTTSTTSTTVDPSQITFPMYEEDA